MTDEEITIGNLFIYLKKVLGEGSYGKVFEGLYENKVPVAVKRIDISKVQFNQEEIKILSQVDSHENIVRYYCTEFLQFQDIHFA